MDASLLGEYIRLELEKLFMKEESRLKLAYLFFSIGKVSNNTACNESYRRNAVH